MADLSGQGPLLDAFMKSVTRLLYARQATHIAISFQEVLFYLASHYNRVL